MIGSLIGGFVGSSGGSGGPSPGQTAGWAVSNANNNALAARRFTAPYTEAGFGATNEIMSLLGLGHLNPMSRGEGSYGDTSLNQDTRTADQTAARNRFMTDPGYEFRLDQGIKARDRSAAAKGMLLSGAQQQGIEDYGQNTASEEYGNYFNRLAALSGQGGNVATSTNSTATGASNLGTSGIINSMSAQAQQNAIDAANKQYLGKSISQGFNNTVGFANYLGAFGGQKKNV